MPNLNSAINLNYKKFFRWWKQELAFLVPKKVSELISDKRGTIIIRPDGNQFILSYWFDWRNEPLIKIEADEGGSAQFQELLASDEKYQKADIILRLTRKLAIQKELSLPAAAKENLYQVVTYELSRYSPFSTEHAYYDVKALDVNNEPGQLRVVLILTAREVLDTLCRNLKTLGITPKFADYEDIPNDLEGNEASYNLLPDWLRPPPNKSSQLIHGMLTGLAGLMLLLALALPVLFEFHAVNALQEKIDAIEKDAKNTKALQSEVVALVEETQQLIDKKTEKPPIVEVFDTLSKLIKDDTWLAYAQYANGQLQMQGESPAASTLISVLEDSDLFANAKFVSPVTRDNVSKLERFQISVDITKAGDSNGTDE